MAEFPMFPLGSVLFPYMPLQLRVFEERYLIMLARILDREPAEFGVVLIERGSEVGGGEQRFEVGTVAQIAELEAPEGYIGLIAEGERRFEVVEWLEEDPYPRAVIRGIPNLDWNDAFAPLRDEAERVVRRTLALASEYTDQAWSATVELSDDPIAAAWQLAAIAPIGQLDQIELLRSRTLELLLTRLIEFATLAQETVHLRYADDLTVLEADEETDDDERDDEDPEGSRDDEFDR